MKKNNKIFKNSKKSLPSASHTKGYYRFVKNYPSETDENRYRNNENIKEKHIETRGRLIIYFAIIFAFILSFIAMSTALQLSNKEPKTNTTNPPLSEDLNENDDYDAPIFGDNQEILG